MKATIMLLAALAISAVSARAVQAQNPIQPVVFGAKGGDSCGCGDGSCDGGSGGKVGLFAGKLGKGGDSCADDSCGGKRSLFGAKGDKCGKNAGDGCGHKPWLLKCLCKPCPSTAPSCHRPNYPLGFPNSPYVRSPRDYFMGGQCGCNGTGSSYGWGY